MCQSSIISQILELIYRKVTIFILDCVTVQTENLMVLDLARLPIREKLLAWCGFRGLRTFTTSASESNLADALEL